MKVEKLQSRVESVIVMVPPSSFSMEISDFSYHVRLSNMNLLYAMQLLNPLSNKDL